MAIEYRICWNADSNASFHGHGDWEPGQNETADEEIDALNAWPGAPGLPMGLELALDYSGFDWWVETREVEGEDEA